jgi:hypothetical protein
MDFGFLIRFAAAFGGADFGLSRIEVDMTPQSEI